MSYVRLLSAESRLSEFDEDDANERERKKVSAMSKSIVEPEIFRKGLEKMGKSWNGVYVYLKLNLASKHLKSIRGIEACNQIVNLDISNNEISSLKPLSSLKHLFKLDASHNLLTTMFDFEPPANIMYVNYSNNQLTKIENLKSHKYIHTLILDNNLISKIENFNSNPSLKSLSINANSIDQIENLENLQLHSLFLAQNKISEIAGLESQKMLTKLDLSRNKISKLKGLENNEQLRFLDLSENNIRKVKQIVYIEDLPLLTELDLCFNSIQTRKYYRYQVLYRIPQLRKLDGTVITAEEKVKAENLHGLDKEDREKIFNSLLPEEQFIDRRVQTFEDIDPESDSDMEDSIKENMKILDSQRKEGSSITEIKKDSMLLDHQMNSSSEVKEINNE